MSIRNTRYRIPYILRLFLLHILARFHCTNSLDWVSHHHHPSPLVLLLLLLPLRLVLLFFLVVIWCNGGAGGCHLGIGTNMQLRLLLLSVGIIEWPRATCCVLKEGRSPSGPWWWLILMAFFFLLVLRIKIVPGTKLMRCEIEMIIVSAMQAKHALQQYTIPWYLVYL